MQVPDNFSFTVSPCLFGGQGDGRTLSTEAFALAVEACEKAGGGILTVPAGVWLCGSLRLCSRLTLCLEKGAVLKAAGEFPPIGFWHNEMGKTTSFLWAIGENDITLCGEGVIDFSSEIWYPDSLPMEYALSEEYIPEDKLCEGLFPKNETRLNQPVFFDTCEHVRVEGVTFLHSPCWTVTFSRCADIFVSGVSVDNDRRVPNSDGIHFSASRDGRVESCDFSCGDDCIALTCITDFEGVNRNIIISDCRMKSRSAALRIGHNAEHVIAENLSVCDTNRGIGIFTRQNSRIEDVLIRDVSVETCLQAGPWWGKAEALVICSTGTASLESVTVENLTGLCENGVFIYDPDGNMKNVTLRNIRIGLKKRKNFRLWCSGLDFRPYAWLDNQDGPFPFFCSDSERVIKDNVSITNSF